MDTLQCTVDMQDVCAVVVSPIKTTIVALVLMVIIVGMMIGTMIKVGSEVRYVMDVKRWIHPNHRPAVGSVGLVHCINAVDSTVVYVVFTGRINEIPFRRCELELVEKIHLQSGYIRCQCGTITSNKKCCDCSPL